MIIVLFALLLACFAGLGLDVPFMVTWTPLLLRVTPVVLYVALFSLGLAIALGVIVALAKQSRFILFRMASSLYVSFIRGVPLVVVIFLVFLALPQLAQRGPGWMQSFFIFGPITSAVIALGVFHGAALAEIFRAGMLSIPRGQHEAALAIGMTTSQVQRRIILPQALRFIIPPLGSNYQMMTKDTAFVGFLGVSELFSTARTAGEQYNRLFELVIVAGGIYWCITIVFQVLQAIAERRLEKAYSFDRSVKRDEIGLGEVGELGLASELNLASTRGRTT